MGLYSSLVAQPVNKPNNDTKSKHFKFLILGTDWIPFIWSGGRESNPRSQLGKLKFYH